MDFNITTPALLFSAISLWMLAFTNRFLAVANLVRQFVAQYTEHPDQGIKKQLDNFRIRLLLIKYTQFFGVLSFFLCVLCMLLIFASYILIAEILFAASLIVLMASIAVSMYEVFISIGALKLELEKVDRL
ncbi:MAG TPA: DUF2721 domain-containing protein [Treponemataceae bacterium]|jgi:hypothetical protein|nr:MAG: hypothetical protein BWY39_01955 [Spirochaetes bacterium ADurb.Bin269]TAH55526.1 MAG: DUF2721 domain-containing protein [Treponema sp.]HOC29746.1 DUF2721 domain-containing protein [Treponemataceae bacterium]HQL32593.1 DUF2721 domain-containing protein [Treponemataceae bacterium]